MDIPDNDYDDSAKVEKATAYVLEKFRTQTWAMLTWGDFQYGVALKVAEAFVAKGYHARSIDHMRGNGPGWFWYGIEIRKEPFPSGYGSTAKASSRILG